MFYTCIEIFELAEYGRQRHGWKDFPLRLACKKLDRKFASYEMPYLEQQIQVSYRRNIINEQ